MIYRKLILIILLVLLLMSVAPLSAQDAECESGFRLFDHATLATDPVCISENPQRIIALDEGTMADLIALGIRPVGVQDNGNRDYTRYLNTEDIASVGTPDGPSYEAMLALDPDLIIGSVDEIEFFGEDSLEFLQEIAPTAISSVSKNVWQDYLTFIADVVGESEEAASFIQLYDQRIIEFKAAIEERDEDFTIAIIRSRAESFNIYAFDIFFIVGLVWDAGLAFPESFADLPERNEISLEQLDLLNSDYLFVMIRNEDEGALFESAVESPLWQFLPAVQNDQVYEVNWSTWVAGWNVIGAHLVVDDLFFYLTASESPTPNPFVDIVIEGFGSGSEPEAEG